MSSESRDTSNGRLRDVRYRLEAAGLRVLFRLIRLLPLDRASALGGWLGRTIGPRIPRSGVARANLKAAFPEKTDDEITAIIRGMWDNLGRVGFELALVDRFTFVTPDSHVEIIGTEHLDAMRDDGKAGILFSGHFANWELFGKASAAANLPLDLVYRAPNNPHVHWMYERRRSGSAELVPKGSAGAKRLLALIRERRHLGLLVDQKMNDGIAVPFFGRDAMTAPALAQFALRFDCPAHPARLERLAGTRFRITVFPALTFEKSGDTAADIRTGMMKVNAILEGWIRERPEQWLWLHRRWPKQ